MTRLTTYNASLVRHTVRTDGDAARASLGLPSHRWTTTRDRFDLQHRLMRDLRANLTAIVNGDTK